MIGKRNIGFDPTRSAGRREAKYALESEAVAAAIRQSIEPHVRCDPYAADLPDRRYRLVSLYLDTPALDLYHDTVRGEKNRYKLRVRRYYRDDAPAFFEVKRRVNDIIRKRRAAVHPEAVEELLAGSAPRRSHVFDGSTAGLADLLHFRDLASMSRATPRIRVRYEREPWIGRVDPSTRITFDRGVVCTPTRSADVIGRDSRWIESCRIPVILEIKFDRAMPEWVARLVHEFELYRRSVPKYVLSVDAARKCGLRVEGRAPSAPTITRRPPERSP